MISKTILAGLVAIAFVGGSITTGTTAYAASNAQGQPFQQLKQGLEDLKQEIELEITGIKQILGSLSLVDLGLGNLEEPGEFSPLELHGLIYGAENKVWIIPSGVDGEVLKTIDGVPSWSTDLTADVDTDEIEDLGFVQGPHTDISSLQNQFDNHVASTVHHDRYTDDEAIAAVGPHTPNTDTDPSNELQTLSLSSQTLSISDGNSVELPTGTTSIITINTRNDGILNIVPAKRYYFGEGCVHQTGSTGDTCEAFTDNGGINTPAWHKREILMPISGTVKNLVVESTIGSASFGSPGAKATVTLFKLPSALQSLNCELEYPLFPNLQNRLQCMDTSNSLSVNAGDKLILMVSNAGSLSFPVENFKVAFTVE